MQLRRHSASKGNAESERWYVQISQNSVHTFAKWMRNIFQIEHFGNPRANDVSQANFGATVWGKTHNPTTVTNTTRVEKAMLSLRTGEENHRQNCAITRPVSNPCTNKPAIPGPSTSTWLCKGPCGIEVELDMMVLSPQDGGGGKGLLGRQAAASLSAHHG